MKRMMKVNKGDLRTKDKGRMGTDALEFAEREQKVEKIVPDDLLFLNAIGGMEVR